MEQSSARIDTPPLFKILQSSKSVSVYCPLTRAPESVQCSMIRVSASSVALDTVTPCVLWFTLQPLAIRLAPESISSPLQLCSALQSNSSTYTFPDAFTATPCDAEKMQFVPVTTLLVVSENVAEGSSGHGGLAVTNSPAQERSSDHQCAGYRYRNS